MATSSIFTNFKISDQKQAADFITALEISANDSRRTSTSKTTKPLTDLEQIRKLLGFEKNGEKK